MSLLATIALVATSTAPVLTEPRVAPDFGRPDEGTSAEEVALMFPRVLFTPISLPLDILVRRPIGWGITTIERTGIVEDVRDVFTWDDGNSGLFPTFFLAYRLQPSVGLVFFTKDQIAPGHSMNVSLAFGGVDYLAASAQYAIGPGPHLELGVEGGRRPDRVYSGIGWDSIDERYRYKEAWYDAHAQVRAKLWRESEIAARAGIDGHTFDENGYSALSDSTSLASAIDAGVLGLPPGLDRNYVAGRVGGVVALDSRRPEPESGTGFRIDAQGEIALDVTGRLGSWARWGGSAGGFLDLGNHRILGLWALARFADPIGGEPLSFNEHVILGDEGLLMQGFLRGQLRGRSATAATLEYIYPVWTALDGRLHFSVGNAFDAHLKDFAAERLRMSFGLGLATVGDPNEAFQFLVAAGTAPFADGAAIESVQLVIGKRTGF